MNRTFQRRALAVGSIALLGLLAACGSDDSDAGSATTAPASTDADSEGTSTKSSAVGTASGTDQAAGATVLEPKTIGVWQAVGAAEVQQRTAETVTAAIDALGWEAIVVDGEGDPSTMQQRLQSLVDSKVDAIVLVFAETGLISKQLEAAEAAGIPVVNSGFIAEDTPLISAQYVGDQVEMATMLTERIFTDMPDGGKFAAIHLPVNYGVRQRVDTFKSMIEDKPEYELVAERDVALSDLFGGTTKSAVDILNANPELDAFFSCCDFGGQAIAPALDQTRRDVPVYSFYAIPSVLDLVRDGAVTVVESDAAKTGAMAVGALADYFVNGTEFDAAASLEQYGIEYLIVDSTNAPETGSQVFPLDEMMAPFLADWAEAYGVG